MIKKNGNKNWIGMQVNTIRGTTKANIKKTDQMQRMRRTSFNDWHRR
jgi:hypothetical protein